jgi:hypothetical protein
MRPSSSIAAALAACAVLVLCVPASALTMQECSAKFTAAKKAGTLNGQRWNDFRKAECGQGAAAAEPAKAPEAKSTEVKSAEPKAAEAKPAAPTAGKPAVFPPAIDEKFAKETPAKGRLHTCAAQFKANKTADGNGGLRWIQKGGGYYSECNKRLKGGTA